MDENRHVRQLRLRPHVATQFRPAHQGHHPVGNDEIGHALPDTFKRLVPVTSAPHVISFPAQYEMPHREEVRLVIDEQD